MALNADLQHASLAERAETDGARDARLEQERLLLEEAKADVRAGRVIAGAALTEWLYLFSRSEPLPPPPLPKG